MSLHHCLCCDTTNNIKLSTDFDSTSWISKFLLLLVYKQKITFFYIALWLLNVQMVFPAQIHPTIEPTLIGKEGKMHSYE